MKLYSICFFTLFVFIINTQIPQAKCPPVCKCTSTSTVSDQCFICLEKQFKRNYRTQNNTCPCIQNYVQNYPPTNYCCAKNCTLCYWQGCYECRTNWTMTLNGAYYICVCEENYYYDPDLDDCICLSNYEDQLTYYYSPTRFQCYICPQGCLCYVSGCYQCNQQSHREVTYNHYNHYACYCLPNYTEINGQCIFTEDIQRPNCVSPRIQLSNGSCICIQPYYQDEQYNCRCKSILDPTSYYQYHDICYRCPNMCKCNKYGCVYCSILANRIIHQNNCSCVKDTGIFQLNGQCICVNPYNKTCYCNNLMYPSLFINVNNQCKKCPKGCKCDKTGCTYCNQISRRNNSCVCLGPFVQLDGSCIGCPQNYMYINNSCICATIYSLNLFYQDNIHIRCNHCPPGCTCNEDGCNSCNYKNPNRVIISNCTAGFYQDQSYICQSCSKGCIKCISYDICEQCDISNDYYLVFNKKSMLINCVRPDFSLKIFYQEKDNIILQIQGIKHTNSTNLTTKPLKPSPTQYLSTKNLSIYLILLTDNVSISTIKLNVLECEIINTNVLVIKFNNLTNDQLDPFLLHINSTNQSGFVYQKYYLMKDEVYAQSTINYSGVQIIFIYLMIVCIMTISLILNIYGEKHNQLMYYCQTIYFIAMNVKDTHMYLVPFLNYFRITIFNFTLEDSGSPFNNYLSDWTIYFQKSYGNYRYFSVDDNLIRNVGLALYLAIQNLFLEIIFRIIYAILFRSKYKLLVLKYKKIVYRSLQWMRKITMYPLLFYSLSTLILYQSQYSLIDQSFRQQTKLFAIVILIYYAISTFIQFNLEQISKIYRYELLLEYLFDIINSVIIITSVYHQYILFVLIPSLLLKNILQYVKYRLFMRNLQLLYNYINILYLFECLIIIPIYFCNLAGTLTLILLYVVGIVMLRVYLIKQKYNQAELEKKIVNMKVISESQTQSKFVDIQHL